MVLFLLHDWFNSIIVIGSHQISIINFLQHNIITVVIISNENDTMVQPISVRIGTKWSSCCVYTTQFVVYT